MKVSGGDVVAIHPKWILQLPCDFINSPPALEDRKCEAESQDQRVPETSDVQGREKGGNVPKGSGGFCYIRVHPYNERADRITGRFERLPLWRRWVPRNIAVKLSEQDVLGSTLVRGAAGGDGIDGQKLRRAGHIC